MCAYLAPLPLLGKSSQLLGDNANDLLQQFTILITHYSESKHSEETQLWEAERARAAGELGTVTQKSVDLESQNTLLHTQLDSLSKGKYYVLSA